MFLAHCGEIVCSKVLLIDIEAPATVQGALLHAFLISVGGACSAFQMESRIRSDAKAAPYPVRLETLQYGMVAEIVHYGPYEEELPTIRKLKQYIAGQGYEIAGLHEEEYFKGPGLPFIQPKNYITVIRYQVRKQ